MDQTIWFSNLTDEKAKQMIDSEISLYRATGLNAEPVYREVGMTMEGYPQQ